MNLRKATMIAAITQLLAFGYHLYKFIYVFFRQTPWNETDRHAYMASDIIFLAAQASMVLFLFVFAMELKDK